MYQDVLDSPLKVETRVRTPLTTSKAAGQEGSTWTSASLDSSTCRNRAAASRARASSRSARSSRPVVLLEHPGRGVTEPEGGTGRGVCP